MNKEQNERITYEEFMAMFKFAPRMAYMLYDKAEDEIDRLNNNWNELEEWLNKSIEYLLYGDTNKILRNTKEQLDEYGYFHNLGSINDIEGCFERVRKKLKEIKDCNNVKK